ncbi:MAG: hypothetical protein IKT29_01365 [Flavobacteriales bacterium]|nr:hypothetical protein [Flavobacteriales bacterium]
MRHLKILLLPFAAAINLHAQNIHIEQGTHIDRRKLTFGIKTSVGAMKYHIDHSDGIAIDYRPSIYAGLYGVMKCRFWDFIELYSTPGVNFSDGAFDSYINDEHTKIPHKSFFIDLPIGIKFYGRRDCNIRPTIDIGTGYSLLLNPNVKISQKNLFSLPSHSLHITGSIGVDIYTPYIKISPSVGYNRSIICSNKKHIDDILSHMIKNMYISRIFFSIIFQ